MCGLKVELRIEILRVLDFQRFVWLFVTCSGSWSSTPGVFTFAEFSSCYTLSTNLESAGTLARCHVEFMSGISKLSLLSAVVCGLTEINFYSWRRILGWMRCTMMQQRQASTEELDHFSFNSPVRET